MDAHATQPGRDISVQVPEDGVSIVADEALLAQLVSILVANALAHTPPSAQITLTADEQGDHIRLVVADTGPGIDPEVAGHVFDRFWRRSTGRERKTESEPSGSTGLGLAIAQSIVEQHRGAITLDTTPGLGSRFIVHLPHDV